MLFTVEKMRIFQTAGHTTELDYLVAYCDKMIDLPLVSSC